jgi:gamma-butyrobetaine dioxygenase
MWVTHNLPTQRQAGSRIVREVGRHRTTLNRHPNNPCRSITDETSTKRLAHGVPKAQAPRPDCTPLLPGPLNSLVLKRSSSCPLNGLKFNVKNGGATRSAGLNLQASRGVSVRPYHTDVASPRQVTIGDRQFSAVYLRDGCTCPRCVDPSSKQKNFQTTDIPPGIQARAVEPQEDGSVKISWSGDIPGFGDDHISNLSATFFDVNSSWDKFHQGHFGLDQSKLWDKSLIAKRLQHVDYEDYVTQDAALYQVLQQLHDYGLVLLRGVPESEKSVERIAERIGRLRDSFYGRTWDVKSVPQAKNVAYTAQYLGLHMDLLYMRDPPGFQFLHCLKNTCDGGSSLFSDSFYAASKLPEGSFDKLTTYQVPYHYRNAGEHYYYSHPVIELKNGPGEPKTIANINYSPPFQAALAFPTEEEQQVLHPIMNAWREFASKVEDEENLYEYRLQEGECVIFNNRRVLHGRRQFDTSAGERWLKGCYIDNDVFMSRYRVLSELSANGKLESPK